MATKTIAGETVQVNDEGYLTVPSEWTKEIAVEIAKEEGIAEMTADHWKVIDFARQSAASSGGASPTLRTITDGAESPPRNCSPFSRRDQPKKWRRLPVLKNRKVVFK